MANKFKQSANILAALMLAIIAILPCSSFSNTESAVYVNGTDLLRSDSCFKKGALFVNTGILFGCGAVGGEAEFGIFNRLGLQVGAGLIGLNAGSNFHLITTCRNDLTFGILADYLTGINAIVPEMNIGYRFFPGRKARVGISANEYRFLKGFSAPFPLSNASFFVKISFFSG